MREPTFLIIRHAESIWNATGRWQGHGDPPLSERGRRQAAALAAELADVPIVHLVSSDLQRAYATASALGAARGLVPDREPRLRELDIGSWTGLTRREIAARDDAKLRRFEAVDPDVRAGDAESRRALRIRARGFVRAFAGALEVLDESAESGVALVTHLGVINALLPGLEPANAEWHRVRASELELDPQA